MTPHWNGPTPYTSLFRGERLTTTMGAIQAIKVEGYRAAMNGPYKTLVTAVEEFIADLSIAPGCEKVRTMAACDAVVGLLLKYHEEETP